MRALCKCGRFVEWEFVGERTDGRGRRWEIYRCPECGSTRSYCVA